MHQQTDRERDRIIEDDRARLQEEHWGGEPDDDQDDEPEPQLSDYERLVERATRNAGPFHKLVDQQKRALVLAWLDHADADAVQAAVSGAMTRMTMRNTAEHVVNLMLTGRSSLYREELLSWLEVELAITINNDITARKSA